MSFGGNMNAIDCDTVHRLCSGQVVVDLSTAVKELLENSLDAGATIVDIKLKDSGLTSITVSDNGQGIKETDYPTLCRKHWTSKIRSFEDLEDISTFGFRGEALSSLCAMSKVSITTATKDTAPLGVLLEYDQAGELSERKAVAREEGTTVTLSGLFAKWPVRLQDLKKNIRREYQRLVGLVEQYAIVSGQARITLTNQTKSGSAVAIRTPLQQDDLSRLVSVLGSQLRPHMVPLLYSSLESSPVPLKITGHISKPLPEAGRSGGDKQYFFVNGRPCDFPKAKKLVNELFRTYCPTRYPVFAISIDILASTIDVNLTPDKRTILIRHEPLLLDALREVLGKAMEPEESVFSVNRVQTQLGATSQTPLGGHEEAGSRFVSVKTSVPGVIMKYVPNGDLAEPKKENTGMRDSELSSQTGMKRPGPPLSASKMDTDEVATPVSAKQQRISDKPKIPGVSHRSSTTAEDTTRGTKKLPSMIIGSCRNRMQDDHHDWNTLTTRLHEKLERRAQILEESQQRQQTESTLDTAETKVLESMGLNTLDSENANTALSRLIHKSDFAKMSVIGQFNLGFIIARLHQDLYIIDQHASDEKYNFEQLQQRAIISSQPLIRPLSLELSVMDEMVAIEHKDTLMRNGFHIKVDEDKQVGERVTLLSQPVIDQTLFNQQDLLELVGKLCIDPETIPRCERARKMFASRACRKSTMIGDVLGRRQMEAIVYHLSELDHPWNCPHGRPTMRHLYRLKDF